MAGALIKPQTTITMLNQVILVHISNMHCMTQIQLIVSGIKNGSKNRIF